MIRVTNIAFTGYPVTDLPRARGFYEGLLGLKSSMVFENEGKAWIEYDVGSSTLAVTNMSAQWKPSSQGPLATLEVADFDVAVQFLRTNGVRFSLEPMDTPVCRFATVLDPDGNAIAIHQRKGS